MNKNYTYGKYKEIPFRYIQHITPFAKWYCAYIYLENINTNDYNKFDNIIDVSGGFTYGHDSWLGWDYNHGNPEERYLKPDDIERDIGKAINQYLENKA